MFQEDIGQVKSVLQERSGGGGYGAGWAAALFSRSDQDSTVIRPLVGKRGGGFSMSRASCVKCKAWAMSWPYVPQAMTVPRNRGVNLAGVFYGGIERRFPDADIDGLPGNQTQVVAGVISGTGLILDIIGDVELVRCRHGIGTADRA